MDNIIDIVIGEASVPLLSDEELDELLTDVDYEDADSVKVDIDGIDQFADDQIIAMLDDDHIGELIDIVMDDL